MRTFDLNSDDYDGRKRMAETLARSSGASVAAIGIMNMESRHVVDMWTGRGKHNAALTETVVLDIISRTLATSLSLGRVDPALGQSDSSLRDTDAPIWLQSRRYVIGIGERVGDMAPFVALINDPPTQADTAERRKLIELGLAYADQMLHEQANGRNNRTSFLPDMILRSLSFGFAVVDGHGAINYLKEGSEDWLAPYDDLRIVNGRLTARTPQKQVLLQAALAAAIRREIQKPSVLTFETGEGAPRTVIVLPMPDAQPQALLIFGQNQEDNTLRELVLKSFGLTLAERRLALLLLSGKSLQSAADEANLTISTARSYLKRIFAKTGINRQSQLVTLYYRMMPSVRSVPPSQNL
jgi:DNA-binding CsgD family transcriptional regulator